MANKSHETRQKLIFRLGPSKPRNPVAMKARQLSAGRHEKSTGAKRADEKVKLKETLAWEESNRADREGEKS
jgi:hypothetical protein